MRVAIALFKTRVSPRFDYAQEFLIAETANGEVLEKRRIAARNWTPLERIKRLTDLEIDTLISGVIDRCSVEYLSAQSINTFCGVTGEAEDALRCLLKGDLESNMMVGSNGCCCGHWHFRSGRNHPSERCHAQNIKRR